MSASIGPMPHTARGLKTRYAVILKRIEDAQFIGWVAMEQSFSVELEATQAQMVKLGVSIPIAAKAKPLPPVSEGVPIPDIPRKGAASEQCVIQALRDGGESMDAVQIAQASGYCNSAVNKALVRLREQRLVRRLDVFPARYLLAVDEPASVRALRMLGREVEREAA